MDYVEVIAIGIETLGVKLGNGAERRARAALVERALELAGYKIMAKDGSHAAKDS